MVRRGLTAALALLLLSLVGCGDPRTKRGDVDRTFGRGRLLVTQGKYAEALPVLEEHLAARPTGKHASRAQFFIGKAYVGMGQLDKATAAFGEVVQIYPDSLEAHKARYKMALILLWQGKTNEARVQFAALADSPDGPLAPEAKQMAAHLAKGKPGQPDQVSAE